MKDRVSSLRPAGRRSPWPAREATWKSCDCCFSSTLQWRPL